MRPSSLSAFLLLSISLLSLNAFGQAGTAQLTANDPRHETLNQQVVSVLFDQQILSATATGWTVTVNGTSVAITSIAVSTDRINITFDATLAHAAYSFIIPGDVVRVSYDGAVVGSNTLTNTAGTPEINSFTDYQSKNRWTPGCGSDIEYQSEGLAPSASQDQCAPVNTNYYRWTYAYSMRFRNSSNWSTTANYLGIQWGYLGQNTIARGYLSDGSGSPNSTFYITSFQSAFPAVLLTFRPGFNHTTLINDGVTNAYSYPDNTNICNFRATVAPVNGGFFDCINTAALRKNTQFDSFDFDDQNTGQLSLPPSVTNSDRVCLGTDVSMTFTNTTDLNCNGTGDLDVPPNASGSPSNSGTRWVRFIYGTLDAGAPNGYIPNILVGTGTPVPVTNGSGALIAPYNANPILGGSPGYVLTGTGLAGAPDANGVMELTGPVSEPLNQLTQLISTISTTGHTIQQRFYVTMQFWGPCNRYDLGASPVSISTSYIEIIDKPLPALPVDKNFCYNEDMTTTPPALPATCTTCFEVTAASVTGNTEIKWYSSLSDASGDASPITNDYGSQSRFLRPSEAVFRASTTSILGTGVPSSVPAGDTYSVWVRYRTGSAVPNNCLSDPVEVKIVKREQLTTPTSVTSTASFPICSNTTAVPFTVAPATGSTTLGGAWNYTWSTTGGGLTINPAGPTGVNMTLDIAAATSGAKSALALRKYTTLTTDNKDCASGNQSMNFNVDLRPLGGSITGGTTPICLGSSTGTMTLGSHSGNILRWEVNRDNLGWNPITNTVATYSETPSLPGSYEYRAVLANGVCAQVVSLTRTIVVNQRPASAVLDGTATICSPGSTNLTVAITGGASPYTVVYNDGSGNTSVPGYVSGANISVTPSSTRTYTLVSVTDANGCTAISLSGTPVVTVSNPTSAVIDGDFDICPNQSSNFNVVITGGVGPYTLRYRLNMGAPVTVNGYVSGTNISTGVLAISGTYTYTIEDVRDQNTCLSLSNSGSAIVVVGSTPSAATFAGGGSVCKDLPHNLTLTITGGVAPYTLLIDNGVGTINSYSSGANIPVNTGTVGTLTYNVTLITDACGSTLGAITNNGQAVTVNPLPTITSQTPTVCSDASGGNTATVNLTSQNASIHATGAITWFTGYTVGTKTFTGSIATPTSYVVTHNTAVFARVQDGNGCVSPATATYTVQPKATITVQPASGTGICDGGNKTFSVTATGTDVSFQWQEDADGAGAGGFADITDGGVYGGATTNSLTLTGAPLAMNGRFYRVRVTSFASGTPTCPINSNNATLTVNAYPGITTHPANDAKCVGQNSSFTVVATGTGLSYRWQIDADGAGAGGFIDLNNGGIYSNVTNPTLNLTNVTSGLNGAFYRVRVSRATSCEIFSNAATFTVNPLPTVVTINPVLCDEFPGGALNVSSVTLSAYDASVTDAPTVVWYSNPGRTTVVTAPSITHGNIFYWRGTSAATCESVGSVQFTVEDLPDAVDKSYSFCEDGPNAGTASSIDLTALEFGAAGVTNGDGNAGTRNVLWFSDAAYTIPIDNPGTVGFNEETDFTITATVSVYARVINTSSASTPDCFDDAVVTLEYKPMPVVNAISGDATLCSSAGIVKVYSVNATTNNYGAIHNYTWSIDGAGDNFEVFVAGSGFITTNSYTVTTPDNLIIVMFPNPGDFHFEVYETIDDCTGDVNVYDVSVTGAPAGLALASPATQVCKDQTGVTYTLSTPPLAGSTYTWTVIGGTVVGASSGLGLGTITVNWGSFTSPQPRVTVTETNSNGCSSAPVTVNITLNDVPSITSPNTSLICSGSTPNTALLNPFTANIGGVACTSCTFSWRIVNATANVTSGGLQIPVFPSAGSTGTGNNIPINMVNASGVNGTVIFEVTAIENDSPNPPTCGSATQTYTVTIKPEPVVNTVSNIAVCSGDAISAINFSGNAGGETFNWVNDNPLIGISAGSTGSINAFTAADNFDATDMVANITVTATKNGCTSAGTNAKTFTITIHPEPVYDPASPTICSDGALGLDLSTLKNGVGVNASAFNITNINANGLTPSAGSPATGNGLSATAISDDAWTNTTNNPVNVIYTIVPVAGTCTGDQFLVTVIVTPEPVYNNSSPTRCSDEAINLNLTSLKVGSSVTASTFNITNIVANGLTPSAGSPAIANGLASNVIMDDAWTNVTNSPVNVVYTIVPVNGTCTGTPFTVSISVSPEPVYSNSTPTVCSDGLVAIDFSTLKNVTSITASAFNITNIVDNGLTASAGSPAVANGLAANVIMDDAWTNTDALPVDVVYTVVPVNGTCAGTPFTITVTVNPEPVYDLATPTRCSDEVLGLDLGTLKNGTGVSATTFNITSINANGLVASGGVPVTGSGFTDLEIADDAWTNTTSGPVNVIYTITPVATSCQGTSFTVTVTVNPEPVYSNATPTRCSDETININLTTLKVASSVTATTFNITNIVDNGLVASAGSPAIANGLLANVIMDDAWRNTTAAPVNVVYTIVPLNGTCQGTPFTLTLSVNPEPVYDDATPTVCSDDALGLDLATLKDALSITATTFNITNIVNNGLVASAGSPAIVNGLASTVINDDAWRNLGALPVDVVYTIVPVNGTCLGTPFTVTVTVNPEPVFSNALSTRCSDEVVGTDLSTLKNGTGVNASTFNITNINANGLIASAGSPATGTGFGAMEISNDAWTNTTALPVSVIYTIIPVNGSCQGTAFTVTVSITPEPVYGSTAPTLCSDAAIGLNLSTLKAGTSVAATTFNITNIVDNGLVASAGSPAVGNGFPSNELIDDAWTNTTAGPVIVEYTIVPVNGTCTGSQFTVTLTVNPEPVYSGASPTRCSDDLVGLDLTTLKVGAGISATGFNITNINANGLTASAGSPATGTNLDALAISDDAWTNTTANPVSVIYTIVPVSGTCPGTTMTISVSVTPEPVYTNTSFTVCSDDLVALDLSTRKAVSSVTATTFNITNINPNGMTASAGSPAVVNGVGIMEISNDRWTNTSLVPASVIYTIVPVNGTCQGTPFTVTVNVNPEPVGASTTFIKCNEEQFNLNLITVMSAASVLPNTFDITVNNGGLTFAGTSPSQGPGKTSNELFDDKWINTTPLPVDVTYDIVPVSSNNCGGTLFTLTFTINPQPTAPAITTASICSDGTFNFDLQTVVDNTLGGGNSVESKFRYSVTSSNPAVSPASARNTASDAPINDTYENRSNTNAVITYLVTPISDLNCEGASFEVRLTVFPEPVGISINETNCITNLSHNIQARHINAIGGNSLNSTFTYTVGSSNAGAVAPGPPRTLASPALITDNYVNTSGSDVTITYTITPFNAANPTCPGTPFTYSIVISSRPVGAPSTVADACSDATFTINPQLNITNGVISTFSWTATFDAGLTGPTSGAGATITGSLTNNTTGVKNAYFLVTPTSGSCSGVPFTITQPINPEPVIDPSVTPRTICSDTPTNIVFGALAGTETPDQYDISLLSQDPDLAGTPTTGIALAANAIQNNSFTNRVRTQGLLVRYEVTPYGPSGVGGCQGDKLIVQVEVLPEPVILPSLANVSICSDVANGIELDTDGIAITATNFFINSVNVQSTGTTIAPNTTVADVTSPLGNITADPSLITGARSKSFIRNDKFTVTNADGAGNNNTVVYNVTPRSGAGCYGDAFNVNLIVLPEPRFDPIAPPPVCSDDAVDLQLIQRDPTSPQIAQYNVAGITFQTGLLPGGSNILIGDVLAADGNGDYISINDKYANPTSTTLNATYAIKPIAAAVLGHSCEGDVVNAAVIIRPSPLVLQNLDKIVCNDAVNGITLGTEATSAAAQSYLVIRNAPAAGLGGGNYVAGPSRVNGATTTLINGDHLVNSQNATRQVTYSVTAYTDPGADLGIGCPGPTEIITVTVEPQILVDNLIGNNSKIDICSTDDTAITLTSLSTPSAGNVTFNFTATSAVPGAVSGISPGSNLNIGALIEQVLSNSSNNPVDVTYNVTPRANSAAGGTGCIGTPSSTIVKVEPKPRMTVAPASLTVCEGVPLGIDFSSVTVPSTGTAAMFFQLTNVEDPNTLAAPANVSGFVTAYPANYLAGSDVLNDNLVNSGLGQEAIRYHFTPSFTIPTATCTGDDVSINVTVSPRPVLLPFTIDPKCSGETFSVDFSTSVTQVDLSSTLATWTFAYTPSGDPDLTGASNGAGYDLSQVIFNRNADVATVTYAIKAKSFTCESNTINIPVQVYPTPKVTGVPSTVNVCNNGAMNVPLNSNALNTLYTWIVDNESQPTLTGGADQVTPVAGPINALMANTSTALGNYTYEITPQVATSLAGKVCAGDPVTLVVNIAPPLDGRITTSNGTDESFLCAGSREFIFLEFDGLPLFDVVYKEGTNTISLTKQGAFKPIQVQPTATTTYELVSVKDAFGCSVNINETATVNINSTNADFAIISPVEACAPNKVSFQHNQQAGVNYTWKWFDGPDSTTYTAAANENGKIIKHTFENPSPVGVAKFKVYLETTLDDVRFPGCLKTTFQEVRVSPNVALGVFPDVTTICSGETVTFTNTTQGAATHRWFFRPLGSAQENEVRTTVATAYKLTNSTTQNPSIIEIVYKADNGKCPGTTTIPITVYRGVDASFNEGTIPPYVAGSATVTFTNTSTPIDGNDFSYRWTFGTNSSPGTASGTSTTIPVTYNLPGLKEVTLVATNTVAAAAGVSCSDTFTKTIEILLPPLIAAFQVNPLAACFPIDLEVTSNTSTGDTYKWQVIDQSGNVAATAQAPKPIFRIVNPGTYDIFLETSSSITGQKAFSQINGVEVYDNPVASLEARPTTLFIPDTELTTFNFSTGANFYLWDFADGTTSEDFEPTHFYTLEGTYDVVLVAGFDHGDKDIDGDGLFDGNVICYDTATRQVIAKEGGLTKVPNAFTPNKDGPTGGTPGNGTFNDTFLPITKGVAREDGSFIMQIFDRWGTLIFESRNQNMGWDGYDRKGNLVPAGVYVYKLDLRLADGQRTTQIGDVTVIR